MSKLYEKYFNIDNAKVALQNPLFSNRYIVFFSGAGDSSRGIFDENSGILVNSVSIPTYTYNAKLQYVGGVNVVVPNLYEQGQLDITIYNTNNTYKTFQKWSNMHYNQRTRKYGYVNDYIANIKIIEFDKAANSILTHIYEGCTLYTYGGIQLTYEESSAIETFKESIQFRGYDLEEEKA